MFDRALCPGQSFRWQDYWLSGLSLHLWSSVEFIIVKRVTLFSDLTQLVGRQEGHPTCKKLDVGSLCRWCWFDCSFALGPVLQLKSRMVALIGVIGLPGSLSLKMAVKQVSSVMRCRQKIWKKRSKRGKHCTRLAVVRRSHKFSPRHRPPSRLRWTAKI